MNEYKSEIDKQLEELGKAIEELKQSIYDEMQIERILEWLDNKIFEHPEIIHTFLVLFTVGILISFVVMAYNLIK